MQPCWYVPGVTVRFRLLAVSSYTRGMLIVASRSGLHCWPSFVIQVLVEQTNNMGKKWQTIHVRAVLLRYTRCNSKIQTYQWLPKRAVLISAGQVLPDRCWLTRPTTRMSLIKIQTYQWQSELWICQQLCMRAVMQHLGQSCIWLIRFYQTGITQAEQSRDQEDEACITGDPNYELGCEQHWM